jgi:hypothetical protein
MRCRRSLKYLPGASKYLSPSLRVLDHVFDQHVSSASPFGVESYRVEGLALAADVLFTAFPAR